MGSSDPTDEEVVALLGVKLTGGREQLILVITQIDAALGEKVRKEGVSIAKLKKILVFISIIIGSGAETDTLTRTLP